MSKARQKGTAGENGVVTYLQSRGYRHVERRALAGKNDRGDIAGIPGVVIEVKNCSKMDLAGWMDEAEYERKNDNADIAVVWHKRVRKGSAESWYVTMDGKQFVDILEKLGYE